VRRHARNGLEAALNHDFNLSAALVVRRHRHIDSRSFSNGILVIEGATGTQRKQRAHQEVNTEEKSRPDHAGDKNRNNKSQARLDGDDTAPAESKEEAGDRSHRKHAQLVWMIRAGVWQVVMVEAKERKNDLGRQCNAGDNGRCGRRFEGEESGYSTKCPCRRGFSRTTDWEARR
jgi:hypothetical protein